MNRFDYCFNILIEFEGGYVFNGLDPGGETKYGISKRQYPHLDIKNLTLDQAKQLYYKDYWLPAKCDQLPNPIDLLFFDSVVNQGHKTATLILQDALNVNQDGIIGANTLARAANADKHKLIKDLLVLRVMRYAKLDSFNYFGKGWMNRLFTLHDKVLL